MGDRNVKALNYAKQLEMVVRGKTRGAVPKQMPQINKKSTLTLLGVTLNEDPNNWDA